MLIEICYYDFGAPMSCFNSFCVVLQPRKQNNLFWIVGSFVCDINFRWGVCIPGLVEIYVLSMGKRTWHNSFLPWHNSFLPSRQFRSPTMYLSFKRTAEIASKFFQVTHVCTHKKKTATTTWITPALSPITPMAKEQYRVMVRSRSKASKS